ncbi:Slufate transporter 2,1 [Hibiscus syriacus]|uniref:Slufate transporter 2,1 n=1 Tax=Hibiscus syriacus TaxID=106335 RepID=A0A6A2X8Y9_HIBSY|nr:Slufate transporter 2,1 [Hibiscus syriacus]
MEISMNTSKLTMVGIRQQPYKVQVISCRQRADNLCMPRGNARFYQVLRLDQAENVGLDEIKKAYRSLVLRYHPDVCPSSKTNPQSDFSSSNWLTRRFPIPFLVKCMIMSWVLGIV